MNDEGALLDTIAAAQDDDDLPRLVYADWLEERGDTARAQFIRAHVELARTPPGTPAFEVQADTARSLLRRHGGDWLAAFAPAGEVARWTVNWGEPGLHMGRRGEGETGRRAELDCTSGTADTPRFRRATIDRGLVGKVQVHNSAVDLERHPVRHLEVTLSPDDAAAFEPDRGNGWRFSAGLELDQPALGRVRTLGLVCQGAPTWDAAHDIAASPHWRDLRELCVRSEQGARLDGLVCAAAAGRSGRMLRALELHDPTGQSLAALSVWPAGRLDELRLRGPVAVGGLAACPLACTLWCLDLTRCDLGPGGLAALADGPVWDRLAVLSLTDLQSGAAQEELTRLARSDAFPAVNYLRVDTTGFTDATAAALATSDWPSRLRVLSATDTPVTAAGLLPLARALRDGPLEQLRVALADRDGPAVRALRDLLGDRLVNLCDYA